DPVVGLNECPSPGVRDQVDGFGGATGEDDLVGTASVEEFRRALASGLESFRRAIAQRMHATVDIGIVAFVKARDRLDYNARLVGRRCVVQIGKRMPVDLLRKDREITAQRGPILRLSLGAAQHVAIFGGLTHRTARQYPRKSVRSSVSTSKPVW